MGSENIVKFLFHMTTTIKLYHWQTTNFARHKATCELHAVLTDLTDQFVEVFMGRYGRPQFPNGFRLNISELSDDSADDMIKEYIDYLKADLPKYLKPDDTDLLNIRDEMLSNLNKTLYLFTLM
jgi:hypothetical protein